MAIEEINQSILDLWKSPYNKLNLGYKKKSVNCEAELFWPNLHPIPDTERPVELLVVGLNPSDKFPNHKDKVKEYQKDPSVPASGLSNNILETIVEPSYNEGVNGVVSALNYKKQRYSADEILEFEKIGQKEHNYFQKLLELGDAITSVENRTYHIDLYKFRESNSHLVKKFFLPQNEDFFKKQAELTFSYIEEVQPKMIFVANKFASDVFFKKYENPCFKEDFGCYIIKIKDQDTPLILSGMITQTRSIDDFSFERLKWHMKKIMNSFPLENLH